jgi:Carbohydrate-binding module 48 (Isoamylase N-terminal domain)
MTISEGNRKMVLGAHSTGSGRCSFTVWAPLLNSVALKIVTPAERLIPMTRDDRGYWRTEAEDVFPGTRYRYRLDGEKDRPDPASRYQREGVHGPSQIVDRIASPGRTVGKDSPSRIISSTNFTSGPSHGKGRLHDTLFYFSREPVTASTTKDREKLRTVTQARFNIFDTDNGG